MEWPADNSRIKGIQNSFDRTFNGGDYDIEFIDATNLKGYTSNHKVKGLEELLNDELKLINETSYNSLPDTVKSALQKTKAKVERAIDKIRNVEKAKDNEPRFPYPTGLVLINNKLLKIGKKIGKKDYLLWQRAQARPLRHSIAC